MNPWIHVAGWTLVHFVWQGSVIALAAAAVFQLLRSASPNIRYGVACTALAAMLVSPIVTAQLLSTTSSASERDVSNVVFFHDAGTAVRPIARPPTAGFPEAARPIEAARVMVNRFLPVAVATWLTGVALLLIRLGGGWWRVRRLHRASLGVPSSHWKIASDRLAVRLRLRRAVHVVDSWLVDTPTVIGWLRPVVLLPIAALANLTPAQVEAILAHELAHIRRQDYLVNLLQAVAETLLFYHPAIWWVSARIRSEREHCCDDLAVELCGDAVGYVAALAEIESSRTSSTGPTSRRGHTALALAATGGSLLERVRRVLKAPAADQRPSTNVVLTGALVVLFIVGASGLRRLPTVQANTGAVDEIHRLQATPWASFLGPISPDSNLQIRKTVILRLPRSESVTEQRQLDPELKRAELTRLETNFETELTRLQRDVRVQATSPNVSGTVLDASGAAIPDVIVVLTEVRTNTDLATRSNQSGHFEFVRLPAGDYLLAASSQGFESFHGRLTIPPGQTVQQNITLQVQSIAFALAIGRVAAGGPGRGAPRPLPDGWICLDGPTPGVPVLNGRTLCGPPSLVHEFEQDRLERQKMRAQPAQATRMFQPQFPQNLWDSKVEGSVVLEGRIRTDGSLAGVEVVAPVHPDFAKVATEALSQWQFQPARLNGVPVESAFTVKMDFRLHP